MNNPLAPLVGGVTLDFEIHTGRYLFVCARISHHPSRQPCTVTFGVEPCFQVLKTVHRAEVQQKKDQRPYCEDEHGRKHDFDALSCDLI